MGLINTTLYVFLVAGASNDTKVHIERIGDSRYAEETPSEQPSEQEDE